MTSTLDQLKILLVEDEAITRAVMENLLQHIGLSQISLAEDGDQARIALGQGDYDLVFSDIEMPGCNGLQLLKEIRCGETQQPRNTRVVIVSSHDDAHVLGTAIALDADAIISKQINVEALQRRISQLLLGPQPEIRSSLAYQVINTDGLVPEHASGFSTESARTLPLEMVQEGMVLAKPVYDSSGGVLIPAGEELTLGKIALLTDLKAFLSEAEITVTASL